MDGFKSKQDEVWFFRTCKDQARSVLAVNYPQLLDDGIAAAHLKAWEMYKAGKSRATVAQYAKFGAIEFLRLYRGRAGAKQELNQVMPDSFLEQGSEDASIATVINRITKKDINSQPLHYMPKPKSAPGPKPRYKLTPRQKEVIEQAATGKTAKEIGAAMFITKRAVEFHLCSLRSMTGAQSLVECLAKLGTWTLDI